MPPSSATQIFFNSFQVTSQVFHRTAYSFAIVNLKPLLPGHVLVCPQRVVPRLHDLRPEEVSDLFLTVQKLGAALEKIYAADGLNIAIQDGRAAGQSVPHVHAHIIPRKRNDLPEDEIYRMLESRDADIARAHDQLSGTQTPSTMLMEGAYLSKGEDKEGHAQDLRLALNRATGGKFPVVKPDAERVPRSEEEMKEEAQWLAAKLAELGIA